MKNQGAELIKTINLQSKIIFHHTKDFLKINIKQEHIIKDILCSFHVAEF